MGSVTALTSGGKIKFTKNKFTIGGIQINNFSLTAAAKNICDEVLAVKAFSFFTMNLDHVVKMRSDKSFKAACRRARFVSAGGFPIVFLGSLTAQLFKRVAGSDLIIPICAEAERKGVSVFLYGSSYDVLLTAAQTLSARFPGLIMAGVYAPPVNFDPTSSDADKDIKMIQSSGAQVCFVALGAPKQELFADRNINSRSSVSMICIGAGLDFLAGKHVRAPLLLQHAGCEWLWRLIHDPRRLARRYASCFAVLPSLFTTAILDQCFALLRQETRKSTKTISAQGAET